MKKGSEPDDTADYWEEKTQIDDNISRLMNAKQQFLQIEKKENKKEEEIKTTVIKSKKTTDHESLEKIALSIEEERQAIEELMNNCYDTQD